MPSENKTVLTPSRALVRKLSERIVAAQKDIRILDAIKWSSAIQADFFQNNFKKLPPVDMDYYKKNPLPYDPEFKIEEFYDIEHEIHHKLGQFNAIGNIMIRMCREYREALHMLKARGLPEFSKISQDLYGSPDDAFYAGGPSLDDLATVLSEILSNLKNSVSNELDEKCYSSTEAVKILSEQLNKYFTDPKQPVKVIISDGIVADAAAGADVIKLRSDAKFSKRDLRILEVHEGWVHVGTTLNGLSQPICTFLSKGPPSSTVFQEGLAVIVEIFTFASHPNRIRKLINRIKAIQMAIEGANFIDIFNFFREQGIPEEESYDYTMRVFRGSTPIGGPFTKDLAYSKGFVLIYNYIRLAVRDGLVKRLPLLFLGKTSIEDLHVYDELVDDGIIVPPKYLPLHFRDLAGLSCWMSYSLFFNKLNLEKFSVEYKGFL